MMSIGLRQIETVGKRALLGLAAVGAIVGPLSPALQAQNSPAPLSLSNSFRIGNEGVRCSAQFSPEDQRLSGMFDRAYRLTCRDAAGDVGYLVALRDGPGIADLVSRFDGEQSCETAQADRIDGAGEVAKLTCVDQDSGVRYRRYALQSGGATIIVEGLAGYDPALRLALASIASDRALPGRIEVAQTEVGDAAAFARVQAGSLSAADARAEAYSRNNSGSFAEAGQFFESLAKRSLSAPRTRAEALANQALQESNLGRFAASKRLLNEAEATIPAGDPLSPRLLRNFRAIDALNQKFPGVALDILNAPMAKVKDDPLDISLQDGVIALPLASQINRENVYLQRLGGVDQGLSVRERAEILDAQALALSGSALLLMDQPQAADAKLAEADQRIANVRGGSVASARWMRSEISLERALIAEQSGDSEFALAAFDRALRNIGRAYPQSPILLATQARKANFLLRAGREQEGRKLFANIVRRSADVPDSSATLRELLVPYFTSLAEEGSDASTALLFEATQLLQRPGVAQSQAVLARQMSEGSGEAAALFNLSLKRGREIVRTEARADRLAAIAAPNEAQAKALTSARESLAYLRKEQSGLLSKLAEFPRYRSLTPGTLTLAQLQGALTDEEAYYKLFAVGQRIYAVWITANQAKSFVVEGTLEDLDFDVSLVRDSVVVIEGGEIAVYPFEVEHSHLLFTKLFGPLAADLERINHLIFEPDGPMLQLPPQILATKADEVETYLAQSQAGERDEFDYTDITWLGKQLSVSIAVSPKGFLNIRNIAPSRGTRSYLGLGANAVPEDNFVRAVQPSAAECRWSIGNWQAPIAADELHFANDILAGQSGTVLTEAEFSDSALRGRADLNDYRVIHFATHGLVSAPAPGCPAEPALITSFGDDSSDGLLTFSEIFDLQLDADLVILSACDTAGMATVEASRAAGVTSGGNYALDGLVRAFVGAGARTIVASHWPVPDEFDATKRLIEGLIGDKTGKGMIHSLAQSQQDLMENADTSHPFYWGAFIVLGDGAKALRSN